MKNEPNELCGFIPIRLVAEKMGKQWTPATRMWLVRHMKQHDAQIDAIPCLFRSVTGHGANWYTTWPAIRHAFPHWLPREKEAAELVAEKVSCYEDRLLILARKVDDLALQMAVHKRWHANRLAQIRTHSAHKVWGTTGSRGNGPTDHAPSPPTSQQTAGQ